MAKQKEEKEITGGELTDYPNDKYRLFFEKFQEIDHVDIVNWKPVHLIAYFCKKYKEQYNTNYQFKFNSPSPPKCFEVFQIKRLAMLLSSNPQIIKDYIDWIFINKVIKAKRKLTSISFMTNEGVVNDYKLNVLLSGKKNLNVDRSTALPEKYQLIFNAVGLQIKTYGELAFISQMDPMPDHLNNALNKIQEIGFDKEILLRIV